tara:strand:- start:100 stop:483 length:384 start_codon:yes stop_codon:yes gene_type:complete
MKIKNLFFIIVTMIASAVFAESTSKKSLSELYSSKKPSTSRIVKKKSSSLTNIYSKSNVRSKVQASRKNYAHSAKENARVFGGEKIDTRRKIQIGDVIEIILEGTGENDQRNNDSPVHTFPRSRNVL